METQENITKARKLFGKRVREERVKAGLSLRDLAEATGVSHVTLGEIERGVHGRWPEEFK